MVSPYSFDINLVGIIVLNPQIRGNAVFPVHLWKAGRSRYRQTDNQQKMYHMAVFSGENQLSLSKRMALQTIRFFAIPDWHDIARGISYPVVSAQ